MSTKYADCEMCGKMLEEGAIVPSEWICFCGKVCAFNWAINQDMTKEPIASITLLEIDDELNTALTGMALDHSGYYK